MVIIFCKQISFIWNLLRKFKNVEHESREICAGKHLPASIAWAVRFKGFLKAICCLHCF